MAEGANPIARRAVLGGLAGLASGAWRTRPEGDEPRLLNNLLTRLSVQVSVNGRPRSRFVIDTGAGRTVLSDDLAARLDLPSSPPVLVHGITAAEIAPTVRVARLAMHGRVFTDLQPPVFPRALLAADGLLGLDVLGRFRLSFDLARRSIRMTPSGSDVFETSDAFSTPTRLRRQGRQARRGPFGQMILLNARAGDLPLAVFVDSGAQYSIGNPAMLAALGRDLTAGERIEVYGVTGQVLTARVGVAPDLRIANQRLGDTPLLFADLHAFHAMGLAGAPALLVGADILFRFRRVTLDFGRSRIALSGLRRPG